MSGRLPLLCLALALLAGCAGVDPARRPDSRDSVPADTGSAPVVPAAGPGADIAAAAEKLVGLPYRFGGSGPSEFDCSGLVFYVHRTFGRDVPRTAGAQFSEAQPVARADLLPGDLVFFRDGQRVTHVGVYVGANRFVHAPKTGRPVEYAHLTDEYFSVNYAGAGRLH
jgi:cell wall-associated NlpC family hydrolase